MQTTLVLLVCLATCGVLVWSNCSEGAAVQITATTDWVGGALVQDTIFTFTLTSSVRNMWASGAKPLACMIAFLSGGWPYIKLLSLGLLRLRGTGQGRAWLGVLDAVGRWSLLDCMFTAIMIVAFRVNMEAQRIASHAQVAVLPEAGLYAFLAAVLATVALGQVVSCQLAHARRTEIQASTLLAGLVEEDVYLPADRPVQTKPWRWMLAPLGLAAWGCLVAAATLAPLFEIEIGGLTASVMAERPSQRYSTLALLTALPERVALGGADGIRFLQIALMACLVLVPAAEVVLACLVVCPVRGVIKAAARQCLDLLGSWAALDCWLACCVACVFQIAMVSREIMGDRCRWVEWAAGRPCFTVESRLLWGAAPLAGCVVVRVAMRAWLLRGRGDGGPRRRPSEPYSSL